MFPFGSFRVMTDRVSCRPSFSVVFQGEKNKKIKEGEMIMIMYLTDRKNRGGYVEGTMNTKFPIR